MDNSIKLPNMSTMSEFMKSRPSTAKTNLSSTSAFKRLDSSASLRRGKSCHELKSTSNLGPGSYDSTSSFRPQSRQGGGGGCGGSMSKSNVAQQFGIIRQSAAPPIGTYDLPRILSPGTVGSEIGLQITSPFTASGGRHKVLMNDGIHYSTLREDRCFSNIGPGYYNTADNWSPTAFMKYNKSRAVSPSARVENALIGTINIGTRSRGKTHDDKPWRQKGSTGSLSPVKTKRSKHDSSSDPLAPGCDPFDTADIDAKIKAVQNKRAESQRDIHSVMNLPNYYR